MAPVGARLSATSSGTETVMNNHPIVAGMRDGAPVSPRKTFYSGDTGHKNATTSSRRFCRGTEDDAHRTARLDDGPFEVQPARRLVDSKPNDRIATFIGDVHRLTRRMYHEKSEASCLDLEISHWATASL